MRLSVALSSPGSSKAELALTTGGGAKNEVASLALDSSLSVRENGVNSHALRAPDVHEEGVRLLHQSLQFVKLLLRNRIYVQ